MLVIIKSSPDTIEAKRALKLAKDISANLVLIQNGAYIAASGSPKDFQGQGTVHVLEEDMKMRGLECSPDTSINQINYDELVDLMADENKVVGMF